MSGEVMEVTTEDDDRLLLSRVAPPVSVVFIAPPSNNPPLADNGELSSERDARILASSRLYSHPLREIELRDVTPNVLAPVPDIKLGFMDC